jgi:putative transcriptional regulator
MFDYIRKSSIMGSMQIPELLNSTVIEMTEFHINRLKVVLAEKRRTNRWLAEEIGVNEATVSRWANNRQQPSVTTFHKIAQILAIDVKDLFETTKLS